MRLDIFILTIAFLYAANVCSAAPIEIMKFFSDLFYTRKNTETTTASTATRKHLTLSKDPSNKACSTVELAEGGYGLVCPTTTSADFNEILYLKTGKGAELPTGSTYNAIVWVRTDTSPAYSTPTPMTPPPPPSVQTPASSECKTLSLGNYKYVKQCASTTYTYYSWPTQIAPESSPEPEPEPEIDFEETAEPELEFEPKLEPEYDLDFELESDPEFEPEFEPTYATQICSFTPRNGSIEYICTDTQYAYDNPITTTQSISVPTTTTTTTKMTISIPTITLPVSCQTKTYRDSIIEECPWRTYTYFLEAPVKTSSIKSSPTSAALCTTIIRRKTSVIKCPDSTTTVYPDSNGEPICATVTRDGIPTFICNV
ncbi:uncharacterized protein VTP21DRAFT_10525 [Calcarisporiella thermophila]|uniref:uncharacterized protein n=1 Tax=Calcarisporiella thermophila TaxID=911321 RepID=UPI003741F378